MAQMKNICGKIPVELHTRVRQEIEQKEISTQEFLQKVIEEHFMEKGVDSMTARTIAVQVSEELFARLKAVIAKKRCRQKEFLIEVIEKAIAQAEDEIRETEMGAAASEDPDTAETGDEEDASGDEESAPEPDGETKDGDEEEPDLETGAENAAGEMTA